MKSPFFLLSAFLDHVLPPWNVYQALGGHSDLTASSPDHSGYMIAPPADCVEQLLVSWSAGVFLMFSTQKDFNVQLTVCYNLLFLVTF